MGGRCSRSSRRAEVESDSDGADFDLFDSVPVHADRAAGATQVPQQTACVIAWARVVKLYRRIAFKRKLWHWLGKQLQEIKSAGRDGELIQYSARRSR